MSFAVQLSSQLQVGIISTLHLLTITTTNGTAVNLRIIKFSFVHPTMGEEVFIILDPCHMLKLARNALGKLQSFVNGEGNIIGWKHIEELQKLQEHEGLKLVNKLPTVYIQGVSKKSEQL